MKWVGSISAKKHELANRHSRSMEDSFSTQDSWNGEVHDSLTTLFQRLAKLEEMMDAIQKSKGKRESLVGQRAVRAKQ